MLTRKMNKLTLMMGGVLCLGAAALMASCDDDDSYADMEDVSCSIC